MSRPVQSHRGHLADAALVVALLILGIQVYLFETVLQSVLDGQRALLPGAFAASLVLTAVALLLAFKVPRIDAGPRH
jgi:predicted Co/Zn/Cd cation transporter (cation efflux family)